MIGLGAGCLANKRPGALSSPGFSLLKNGVAVTYFRMCNRHTIIGVSP